MNMVSNQAYHLDLLADAIAGSLVGAKLALYQNNIDPTPETPIGDYTAATFTGYAQKAITWLAPSIADDGTPEVVGTTTEWRPTDAVTPNSIYGLLLVTAGGALYQAGKFDNDPLPMGSNLDSLLVTFRVRLAPTGLVVLIS